MISHRTSATQDKHHQEKMNEQPATDRLLLGMVIGLQP